MFDFDATKLLIIGVVALVVIGPKDLPGVLRQVGQMVTKLRRMAGEFQGQFMDAMKEADLQDLRKEMADLKNTASLDVAFNPVHDIKTELTRAVEAKPEPSVDAKLEPEIVAEAPAPLAADFGSTRHDGFALPAPSWEQPPEAASVSDRLDLAEPAHHTTASSAGAIDSVSAPEPGALESVKRRRIVVPKRRPPGDRLASQPAGTASLARGRSYLPPRRDPRS